MNFFRKIIIASSVVICTIAYSQKAKIRIIATGGTIAGVSKSATETNYKAGEIGRAHV